METSLQPDPRKIRTINKAALLDQRLLLEQRWHVRKYLKFRRSFHTYHMVRPPGWKIALRARLPSERMRPAFASIGAVRSGTSLLSDYIMQHPCVVLPLAKEVGVDLPRLRPLLGQFPSRKEEARVRRQFGQAITGYCAPVVPYLAFGHFFSMLAPNAKIVMIFRNPVDRVFAHWHWDQVLISAIKRDPIWQRYPDFDQAMAMELESVRDGGGGLTPISGLGCGGYLQHSTYIPFFKSVVSTFIRQDILVVNATDFFSNPKEIAQRVYDFLGLPNYVPLDVPVKNAGPISRMNPDTRKLLSAYFAPINRQFYDIIGEDMNWS